MNEANENRPDAKAAEKARRDLRDAAAGGTDGAERLHRKEHAAPESTEAVEQEASDGPGKRGVSR